MDIKWFGTAGFLIQTGEASFLIDPYLTRNGRASPVQSQKPADIPSVSNIFVSHGHFDHLLDVPEIASRTGAVVYCSDGAAQTLEQNGLPPVQIQRVVSDGWEIDLGLFRARARFSRHVRFDNRLLAATLLKVRFGLPGIIRLAKAFPCGQVLSWRFQAEGKSVLFFGSAGADDDELESLKGLPLDVLLVPLQGHSDICRIAAGYVRKLSPKMVIPHHQDDFFPPLSQEVDIQPFLDQVGRECPETRIQVMAMNETLHL